MLPPWAQIVFVGYMSRDQIHQVIAREQEMLAAIEARAVTNYCPRTQTTAQGT
jgi:hypothetical protein